jgi:nitrate/TMAO reductase-like tetraheme cytochrome c subunit
VSSEPGPTPDPAAGSDLEPDADAPPALVVDQEAPAPEADRPAPTRAAGRLRRLVRMARLRRIFRRPRSRRGLFALVLVVGGFATLVGYGGVSLIQWTETADFCGRCHTMGPELVAHAAGPHRDVACAECHVEPGLAGWVKAKLNGTRQLIEIVIGSFPEPIPAPDHDRLPDPRDTCLKCHDLDRMATSALITAIQFTPDEANTRQFVGLLLRPASGDLFDVNRSVHWHVLQNVEFGSRQANAQQVDWVQVTRSDGTVEEYIAQGQVQSSLNAASDLARLRATEPARPMDCLVCHNRVGHPIETPRVALDAALSAGRINVGLPFIKREAMRLLWGDYPSIDAADEAMDGLRGFYEATYPALYHSVPFEVDAAIDQLKLIYRLTATPELKISAGTYPNNLGHTDFLGCFRCHDGGHFQVRDGALTNTAIPSKCDTCHTFPQLGRAIASVPLGVPPATHEDNLFVFNHKNFATNLDPGGQTCGECHARDFCANCHETGAVTVKHDAMLTNHAAVIRTSSANACAYCHQPVYCARCHKDQVLPGGPPSGSTSPSPGPAGLRWPIIAAAGP